MSRREDHDAGDNDNKNVVVLPDHLFARTTRTEQVEQNADVIRHWVDPHHLKNIDGQWTKDERRVVTSLLAERRALVNSMHDPPAYAHPGISCTVDFVEQNYWWPGLRHDVTEYVQGCGECQRHKVNNRPTRAPFQPIYPTGNDAPFEVVALDFITKLPLSSAYNSILTITNHSCTKMVHFIPCRETITVEENQEMAQLFLETIF